jgi:hypothetical protein
MNITLDNTIYNVYISKINIYFKTKRGFDNLLSLNSKLNNNIKSILKDTENYDVIISLENNIFKIIINGNIIIEYNFNKINIKHKTLKNITINDIAEYNKFKDNL